VAGTRDLLVGLRKHFENKTTEHAWVFPGLWAVSEVKSARPLCGVAKSTPYRLGG